MPDEKGLAGAFRGHTAATSERKLSVAVQAADPNHSDWRQWSGRFGGTARPAAQQTSLYKQMD